MAREFQVTVDCAEPGRLARFWAEVLGYELRRPPEGFADWESYWRHVGLPEEELAGADFDDRIVDPEGVGPAFFQPVPEGKTVKNRLHIDVLVTAGRGELLAARKATVDAEVARLLAIGATQVRVLSEEGIDHYGVVLQDPEGNEFCVT